MSTLRTLSRAAAAAVAALTIAASPASAIVGGQDASAGEYPSVAYVSFGAFACTGTLIAPNYVLTAGHCGSATGGTGFGTPASWPTPLINVRIGGLTPSSGESVPVSQVIMHPNYLLGDGYDIALLKLSRNSTKAPTKISGATETGLWSPSTLETIVGFGNTTEGGSSPDVLQEAQVPVTTDAYCASRVSSFDAAVMLCAGFPEGGVDTCQGDSGGPMFGLTGTGVRRVVGATSFGTGCARPDEPGVYARVGDSTLREWIRSKTPAGVA